MVLPYEYPVQSALTVSAVDSILNISNKTGRILQYALAKSATSPVANLDPTIARGFADGYPISGLQNVLQQAGKSGAIQATPDRRVAGDLILHIDKTGTYPSISSWLNGHYAEYIRMIGDIDELVQKKRQQLTKSELADVVNRSSYARSQKRNLPSAGVASSGMRVEGPTLVASDAYYGQGTVVKIYDTNGTFIMGFTISNASVNGQWYLSPTPVAISHVDVSIKIREGTKFTKVQYHGGDALILAALQSTFKKHSPAVVTTSYTAIRARTAFIYCWHWYYKDSEIANEATFDEKFATFSSSLAHDISMFKVINKGVYGPYGDGLAIKFYKDNFSSDLRKLLSSRNVEYAALAASTSTSTYDLRNGSTVAVPSLNLVADEIALDVHIKSFWESIKPTDRSLNKDEQDLENFIIDHPEAVIRGTCFDKGQYLPSNELEVLKSTQLYADSMKAEMNLLDKQLSTYEDKPWTFKQADNLAKKNKDALMSIGHLLLSRVTAGQPGVSFDETVSIQKILDDTNYIELSNHTGQLVCVLNENSLISSNGLIFLTRAELTGVGMLTVVDYMATGNRCMYSTEVIAAAMAAGKEPSIYMLGKIATDAGIPVTDRVSISQLPKRVVWQSSSFEKAADVEDVDIETLMVDFPDGYKSVYALDASEITGGQHPFLNAMNADTRRRYLLVTYGNHGGEYAELLRTRLNGFFLDYELRERRIKKLSPL